MGIQGENTERMDRRENGRRGGINAGDGRASGPENASSMAICLLRSSDQLQGGFREEVGDWKTLKDRYRLRGTEPPMAETIDIWSNGREKKSTAYAIAACAV